MIYAKLFWLLNLVYIVCLLASKVLSAMVIYGFVET